MTAALQSRPACLVYGAILGAVLALWWTRRQIPVSPLSVAFQHAQPDAGISEATPVTPGELAAKVRAATKDLDLPDDKAWLKANKAHVDGLTTGKVTREQDVKGQSTVTAAALPDPCAAATATSAAAGAAQSSKPPETCAAAIAYDWHSTRPDGSPDGRFTLHDPAPGHPGSATFTARQSFSLAIANISQDGSPLRQEQLALTEVDPETGKVIGPATVSDLRYSYVPLHPPPAWHVGALVAVDLRGIGQAQSAFTGPIAFGAIVERRAIGPIWAGGFALSNGTIGASAGLAW